MFASLPARYNQITMTSRFRRQFQIAAFKFLLSEALQNLMETPDHCDKTFFITTNFDQFDVQLFKLFSPQVKDRSDSESLINTLLFHLLNQNHSLETSHEQKNTDAEKSRMKSSMSSLKQNSMSHLKLKFLQIIPSKPFMDISAFLKIPAQTCS